MNQISELQDQITDDLNKQMLCCVEILKNLPVHSFNALIIPILRDCLPYYFLVFLSFDVSQGGTSALSPLSCSFSVFLARLIAVASTVHTCM